MLVNMVPPYRLRVFERVAESFPGDFVVVSCTGVESNRHWHTVEASFEHQILKGFELRLGERGIAHVNPSVIRVLRRLDPAVLCVGGFTPTMLGALLYARICSKPYVLMMDGWMGADSKLSSPYHRWVRRTFVPRAAAGVGVGEKSMQWFERHGLARNKLFLSPLVPSWRPSPIVPGFQERTFDLLWCGTINERKNIHFFVDLAMLLKQVLGSIRVRVVGEGSMRKWCERAFSEAAIASHFDGFVHGDAIRYCFGSARLFIFPTRHDPWGLVANEATQCGTPVLISSHAGAAGEAVRHQLDGYVLPLDRDAWADAALSLLRSQRLWEEMSGSAHMHSLLNSSEGAAEGLLEAVLFGMRSKRRRTLLRRCP
jgi:glycosyltransferase involved in cell wall biosynthesis